MSAAQLALWFIDRGKSKKIQQVEGCLLRIAGDVAPQRLHDVIASTVRRHPALRIGCEVAGGGQPRQRVYGDVPWSLEYRDLSALPPEAAQAEATRWWAEVSAVPFDLGQPPLWRAAAARLPGGRSLIALAAHHLICDGWTLRLLLEEMSEEYRTGAPAPGSPAPYPQCLLDRNDTWRRDPTVISFWRSVLDGCESSRVVIPGTATGPVRGEAAVHDVVSPDVARLIRDVARRHRVTAFLVTAAVYAVTIGRFSGIARVPVAVAAHGRTAPGLNRVAGLFATMFVLPADLAEEPSLSELLARLRETYRDCLAHRNIALEELTLERKLTREPFFRHMISYHPASFAVSRFAGLPAAMDLLSVKPSPNELELHVRELADSFALDLRFDPAVLNADEARTVLDAYGGLLACLAADPGGSVARAIPPAPPRAVLS